MGIRTLYKVVSGSSSEVEQLLNVLAKEEWRPVTAACHGQPNVLTVILENKIMEEAKLNLPSTIGEQAPRDGALEEIQ
jgi:hypothetical protein